MLLYYPGGLGCFPTQPKCVISAEMCSGTGASLTAPFDSIFWETVYEQPAQQRNDPITHNILVLEDYTHRQGDGRLPNRIRRRGKGNLRGWMSADHKLFQGMHALPKLEPSCQAV